MGVLLAGGCRSAPAQAAAGGTGWEYVSRKVPYDNSRWQFQQAMNDLGKDGWEVFEVMLMPSSEYDHGCYVFARRPVGEGGQPLVTQRSMARP